MGQDEAKELINAVRFSLRGLCCAVAAMLAGPLGAENGYSMETSREVIHEVNSYRVPCVGVAPKQPYIEFNVSRSAYLGNTGCGEFSGEILRIGSQELRLGLMMGGIAQPDCADGSAAARWSGALDNVASWQRNKMILVLFDGNGAEVLRYRKID